MKVLSDLIQCSVLMHLLDAIWFATAVYFAFAPFGDRLGEIMLCFANCVKFDYTDVLCEKESKRYCFKG